MKSKLLALVKANQVRILLEEEEEASALDDENESASEESNGEEPHSNDEYIPPEQGEEDDVFDFQPEQEEGEEEVSVSFELNFLFIYTFSHCSFLQIATASQTVRPRANGSVGTPVGTQYSYEPNSYKKYFYIVRQLIQDEHMDRCYICNQNMNTLEYVI